MAYGNDIVVASPYGRPVEGIISGTPKPGTCMEVKRGVAPVGGRLTWEAYGTTAASGNQGVAADGNQRLVVVLDTDKLQGRDQLTAYVSGSRGFMWVPVPGDELNVLVSAAGTGTGNAIDEGDLLIIDDGTGYLVLSTGAPESEPFFAMEAVSDVVATGTLLLCMFTGY